MDFAQMGLPILDEEERDEGPAPRPLGRRRTVLRVEVSDPDVLRELERRRPGAERDEYARAALRLGVLALRQARGEVDAAAVREAGQELLAEMRELLSQRAAELGNALSAALTHYLDPQSGLLPQRLTSLLSRDGELERVLAAHLGPEQSVLARTLAGHLGQSSALMRMLSPTDADGLRAQLQRVLEAALGEQRERVLREFSLDHKESALSRLVAEVTARQGALETGLRGRIDEVVREFSLDHPGSALSRLVGRVESASQQIGRSLTLDDEQSALSRLRRELKAPIEELLRDQRQFQSEVKSTLAALEARRAEADRSTAHGVTFEEQLGAVVAREAQRLGDVCEATGTTTGAIRNCKTGDFVTTLGPDSPAPGARIAWEAKEDQRYDLRRALAECEEARKNRQAQLGIFVFSKKTAPSGLEGLARYGQDVVVIWDASDPASDLQLRAALSIARALVLRERAASAENHLALGEIELATRAVEKQLNHLEEVRTWAETIRSNGAKIVDRAERMREALRKEVARLDEQIEALRRAEEGP